MIPFTAFPLLNWGALEFLPNRPLDKLHKLNIRAVHNETVKAMLRLFAVRFLDVFIVSP